MKAIQYSRYGALDELRLDEVALPSPAGGQVRVRVRAASYNPLDGKIRRGEMKPMTGFRFPRGLDTFRGRGRGRGPGVERLKAGDEVFGVTSIWAAGAFAEYVVADERNLEHKPPAVSFEQAAAMTIVGVTAWTGLVAKAKLTAGQRVFVKWLPGRCRPLGGSDRTNARRACGRQLQRVEARRCSGARRRRGGRLSRLRHCGTAQPLRRSVRHCGHPVTAPVRRDDATGGLVTAHCSPFAKMIGCSLSRRHRLVFGNPTSQSFAAVADAAGRGNFAAEIGRVVPLSDAIPAIVELERTGPHTGKLVIVSA